MHAIQILTRLLAIWTSRIRKVMWKPLFRLGAIIATWLSLTGADWLEWFSIKLHSPKHRMVHCSQSTGLRIIFYLQGVNRNMVELRIILQEKKSVPAIKTQWTLKLHMFNSWHFWYRISICDCISFNFVHLILTFLTAQINTNCPKYGTAAPLASKGELLILKCQI